MSQIHASLSGLIGIGGVTARRVGSVLALACMSACVKKSDEQLATEAVGDALPTAECDSAAVPYM